MAPKAAVVSGLRCDDLAAAAVVAKLLESEGASVIPVFAPEACPAVQSPYFRAAGAVGRAAAFCGAPLAPSEMPGLEKRWLDAWAGTGRAAPPFYYDNHLTPSLSGGSALALTTCGESITAAAYEYASACGYGWAGGYAEAAEVLRRAANLDGGGAACEEWREERERANVLPYAAQPCRVYEACRDSGGGFLKLLRSAETGGYLREQRKRIAALLKASSMRVPVRGVKCCVYAGDRLYLEDVDNFGARLLDDAGEGCAAAFMFRRDPWLPKDGFTLEVRTKMSEARRLVEGLVQSFGKTNCTAEMATRNRGRLTVYSRRRGLGGGFRKLSEERLAPFLEEFYNSDGPADRLSRTLAEIGF